jgi:diguanylate cyclase (GGDEF)-like protein/PAS domain S-box-containing protein
MDESSKLLRCILDSVGDGVYMVDMDRRITYWNRAAERITGFSREEVMGKGCADALLAHVDRKGCALCQGACPLAHTLKDGQVREDMIYLHHKEGHRIPVQVSAVPVTDEAGKIIGAVETFRECSNVIALKSMLEQLKARGYTDLETGLANRRIVEGRLAERVQELQRFGWPFGILLVEADLLTEVREGFGQEGVSAAMRMIALSVQNSLRSLDTVGRWDSTSLLAVVANATSAELSVIGERVRVMVDTAYRQMEQGTLHVTVSVGAVAADASDSVQSLLQKANRCVYDSRARGRTRVSVFVG